MLDESEFTRWRESAADALEASRDNMKSGWHNWSCMIAEQSARLGVKALLHGVGRGGSARGHDLVRLLETAAEMAGIALTEDVRKAGVRLSRHYQPTRYPDALPGGRPRDRYTTDDAEVAIADAETILDAADEAMSRLRIAAEQGATGDQSS